MNSRFKIFIFYILSLLLVGCAPPIGSTPNNFKPLKDTAKIVDEDHKNYTIGEKRRISVGEDIINGHVEKRLVRERPVFTAIRSYKDIQKNKNYKVKGASRKNDQDLFLFIFEQNGDFGFLKINTDGKLTSEDLYDWSGDLVQPNYIDKTKVFFQKEIKYVKGSFNYQLTYNGKSGQDIKILYSEIKNDAPRSAFYQELSFNLNDSPIIRHKNIKIEVIESTNESIEYIVLED